MSSKRFSHLVKAPTINSSSLLNHIYCNSQSTNIFAGIMDVYYSVMMLLLLLYLCDLLAFGPITDSLEGCVASTIHLQVNNSSLVHVDIFPFQYQLNSLQRVTIT